MKKVRISAGYDKSENLTERLITQFKTSEEDTSNIEFVYDDSYEVVVFFNYVNLPVNNNVKVYVFPQEPTWAGSHQKNYSGNKNVKVFGFDKNLYTPNDVCKESFSYSFYGGRGPWIDKLEDWNYETVINHEPKKTKNISSIITKLYSEDTNLGGCSYKNRYELNEFLIKNAPYVDYYFGWDLKNETEKKYAVKDYKFSISMENQFTKNWISEKFYDSILYNTVPIYFGCQNIRELHPEAGYFIFDDVDDHKKSLEMIEYINNNAEDLYKKMLPEVIKIKNRYFEKYNLLKLINNLCK